MRIQIFVFLFIAASMQIFSQWERQTLPADIGMILTIDFIDSSSGIAGGWKITESFEGRIIYSTNGGSDWFLSQLPDSVRSVVNLQLFDQNTAYAFGAFNTAGKPNKAEVNRLNALLKKNNGLKRVFEVSAQSADESYTGMFLTSTDGGIQWKIKESLPKEIKFVVSASFTNDNIGYVLGDSENFGGTGIYKTSDGGENWLTQIRPDTSLFLRKIKFTCLNTGIGVGWKTDTTLASNGVIYNTADGGETWNINEFPDVDNFTDVFYTNDETAYAVGVSKVPAGVIYQTVDRGFSWRKLSSIPDITFIDAVGFVRETQTGIITGSNIDQLPMVYKTNDGGENWVNQTLPEDLTGFILFAIEMPLDDCWYISGGNWNSGLILHTDNEGITSAVSNEISPSEFGLLQNYPNPFNPGTKIKYSLLTPPQPSPYQGEGVREGFFVSLSVYDILGNQVSILVNEWQNPGKYEVEFDGSGLPSGVYYYQLTVGEFSDTKKMLLLK